MLLPALTLRSPRARNSPTLRIYQKTSWDHWGLAAVLNENGAGLACNCLRSQPKLLRPCHAEPGIPAQRRLRRDGELWTVECARSAIGSSSAPHTNAAFHDRHCPIIVPCFLCAPFGGGGGCVRWQSAGQNEATQDLEVLVGLRCDGGVWGWAMVVGDALGTYAPRCST